ncbi:MAG: hypothetical protein HPY53_11785 [Brevinematales bacterium]|nr:hypothetical protein [Brevinematales bacterium]
MRLQVEKKETFGNYIDFQHILEIKSKVNIAISPSDLGGFWSRCGITADFGASFLSLKTSNRAQIKNSLSFILNELVENAVKYSLSQKYFLSIVLLEYDDKILFEVGNFIDKNLYDKFKFHIDNFLLIENIEEKYIELLSSSDTDVKESLIGIMTIVNIYHPMLGIEFEETNEKGIYKVKVQVTVNPMEL